MSQQQKQNTFVEVAQQLGNQELPTNQQINSMIDSTQHFIDNKKNNPRVDESAMKAMTDLQGVLDATKQLNQNKNFDECLQSALTQTAVTAGEATSQASSAAPISTSAADKLRGQGQQVMEQGKQLSSAIWEVLRSMVSSGELRLHVSTLLGVAQEILSSAQDQLESTTMTTTTVTSGTSNKQSSQTETSNNSSLRVGLSEQKKHELSFNLLSVLRKFHQQPELRSSFRQIVDIFRMLLNQQSAVWPQVQGKVQSDPRVDVAFNNSKALVERFSDRPLDPFLVKSNAFFDFVRRDERVRRWFDDAEKLLRDCFEKPELMDQYEFTQRIEQLIDLAQEVTNATEFKANYKGVVSELLAIVNSIKEDPDLRFLQQKTATFLDNFTYTDAQGVKRFNADLMQSLRQLVVPLLVSQLDTIPLPPIQGSNDDYDYEFDNMVLHGREIIPDKIEIHTRSDLSLDVRNLEADEARTQAEICVNNIRINLSDVHFRFVRKTFPKMSDEGLAALRVEGNSGVSLKLRFELFMENNSPHVKLSKIDFDIDKLTIDIQETQHEVLTRLFATLYQTRTKQMIEQNAEQKIREIFSKMESGMNELFAKYPPSNLKNIVEEKTTEMLNMKSSQQQQQQFTPMQAMQS